MSWSRIFAGRSDVCHGNRVDFLPPGKLSAWTPALPMLVALVVGQRLDDPVLNLLHTRLDVFVYRCNQV